jgi:hypothetical protein
MRTQFAALSIIALLGFAAAPGFALESSDEATADAVGYAVDLAPRECCKICRKGKACGDSCIARDKKCNKPPGCACDG